MEELLREFRPVINVEAAAATAAAAANEAARLVEIANPWSSHFWNLNPHDSSLFNFNWWIPVLLPENQTPDELMAAHAILHPALAGAPEERHWNIFTCVEHNARYYVNGRVARGEMYNIHTLYNLHDEAPRQWTRPLDSVAGAIPRITNIFHTRIESQWQARRLLHLNAPQGDGSSSDDEYFLNPHDERMRRFRNGRTRPVLVHQDRAVAIASNPISRATSNASSFHSDMSLDLQQLSYQDNELLYSYPPEYGTPPADWHQTAQPLPASSSSNICYADFATEPLTPDPPSAVWRTEDEIALTLDEDESAAEADAEDTSVLMY